MMKRLFYIVILILTVTSCQKETISNAKIISDCTGIYIRYHNADYKITNTSSVPKESIGKAVSVIFKIKKGHNNTSEEGVCMLYHPYKEWVKVCKIKASN